MPKDKSTPRARASQVFDYLRVAIDGTFGSEWPKEKIKKFIVNSGGEVVDYKDEGLTHLICSEAVFRAKTFAVQSALKRFSKKKRTGVKLVTLDWMIDSLQGRRKKREAEYDVAVVVQEKDKKKKARKIARNKGLEQDMMNWAKIVSDAKAAYNITGYNLYYDPTGFGYDIVMFRLDITHNSRERLVLRLYESHEPPHRYGAYATYTDRDGNDSREVLAPIESDFPVAFEAFCKEFKYRTHREWRDRAEAHTAILEDGVKDCSAFTYCLPGLGPLGMDLPSGRDHAQEQEQEQNDEEELFEHTGEHDDNDATVAAIKGQETDADEGFETADEGNLGGAMYLSPSSKSAAAGYPQSQFEASTGFTPVNAQQSVRFQMDPSAEMQMHDSQDYGTIDAANQPVDYPIMAPVTSSQLLNAHEFVYGTPAPAADSIKIQPGVVNWNWGGNAGGYWDGRVGYAEDVD